MSPREAAKIEAVIAELRGEKSKWVGTGAYAPMNSAANELAALVKENSIGESIYMVWGAKDVGK